MRRIPIPIRLLSVAFWGALERYGRAPIDAFEACEKNRENASLDTGSTTNEDAIALWRLARCLRPEVIVEVGTFIGRSTTALRLGSGGRVYTCDKDNDCFQMEGVVTHPKKTSTEMLLVITERVDLFFIDGRLTFEDVSLIEQMKKPETVFVFDDFEGVEKGVRNVMKMEKMLKGNIFFQPINGGLAVSIHPDTLAITIQ